jgi:hypothetical protein
MERPRLLDFMGSRGPAALGLCASDTAGCAAVCNAACERLLYAREVGDSGWVGTWSEMQFIASRDDPFITTPRDVARIEVLDLCTFPIPVQNQFYSYLRYGFGRFPKPTTAARTRCAPLVAYDRGRFPLFKDVIGTDKKLRAYMTDPADAGKRVLVGYKDGNGVPVRTLDGVVQVDGEFLTLVAPFVDTTFDVSVVTAIQKDVTLGRVSFFEIDNSTSDQRLLGFMEPGETTASYRRYFLGGIPKSCCTLPDPTANEVQLTALVQLCYVPVSVATDFLVIPSLEAVINECQAGRYSEIDQPNSKAMSEWHRRQAIRLLQGQSVHEMGALLPAVSFKPFNGSPFVTTGYG